MTRAVRAILGVTIVVAAASCSNSRSEGETASSIPLPEDLPLCSELFVQDKPLERINFGKACETAAEELAVPRYVRLVCDDGTALLWNEFAWGYENQNMNLFAADLPVKVPMEEALECRKNSGDDIREQINQEIDATNQAIEDAENAEDPP